MDIVSTSPSPKEKDDSHQTKSTDISKALTENLYKRSTEIAAKNKTLSILAKLYETTALALSSDELATRMVQVIQENIGVELVGIFSLSIDGSRLSPLAFAFSERFNEFRLASQVPIENAAVLASVSALIAKVIEERVAGYTENAADIWGSAMSEHLYASMVEVGHVKSTLVYPLISGNQVLGVLLLCFNRTHSQILQHEKVSVSNLANIVAIALDKAYLYEQLIESNTKLEQSNNRLKELDRQKSEFVSIASHQLRSPLTAMTGYASLLLDGDLGELPTVARDAIMRIFESGKTMAVAIDDFLNVTRIEQGRMQYTLTTFSIADVLKQAVAEMLIIAERKGLSLLYDIPSEPIAITADSAKIKQIITNIIDNAIKYTQAGTIHVVVDSNAADKTISIVVADTGIGLSLADIQKLFGKFSRAENANTVSVRGTGLGLFIAREMARAHGGDICVTSKGRGRGAIFTITLPQHTTITPQKNTNTIDDNEKVGGEVRV